MTELRCASNSRISDPSFVMNGAADSRLTTSMFQSPPLSAVRFDFVPSFTNSLTLRPAAGIIRLAFAILALNSPSHVHRFSEAIHLTGGSNGRVPVPTLERLATYLRYLVDLQQEHVETISSAEVEEQTGINAAQFRKD